MNIWYKKTLINKDEYKTRLYTLKNQFENTKIIFQLHSNFVHHCLICCNNSVKYTVRDSFMDFQREVTVRGIVHYALRTCVKELFT